MPVKVPSCRIPARYRQEVESRLRNMLDRGIIEETSSPLTAPTVFVPQKTGDLCICIDYRAINKLIKKNAYPLPLPDEVQDQLSGTTVFSKLDLHSGYWQMPVIQIIARKQHFVLAQEWDYFSSAECLLVWQELLALFNV